MVGWGDFWASAWMCTSWIAIPLLLNKSLFFDYYFLNVQVNSHKSFIHLSICGHLGWFHVLATINNAAISTGIQMSFELVFVSFIFTAVELLSHDNTIFNCSRILHTISIVGISIHTCSAQVVISVSGVAHRQSQVGIALRPGNTAGGKFPWVGSSNEEFCWPQSLVCPGLGKELDLSQYPLLWTASSSPMRPEALAKTLEAGRHNGAGTESWAEQTQCWSEYPTLSTHRRGINS